MGDTRFGNPGNCVRQIVFGILELLHAMNMNDASVHIHMHIEFYVLTVVAFEHFWVHDVPRFSVIVRYECQFVAIRFDRPSDVSKQGFLLGHAGQTRSSRPLQFVCARTYTQGHKQYHCNDPNFLHVENLLDVESGLSTSNLGTNKDSRRIVDRILHI